MAAGDRWARTEPPTPKRKKQAREEGQVARSPEIGAWAVVLAASLFAPAVLSFARTRVLGVASSAFGVASHPSVKGALGVLGSGVRQFIVYIAVVGGAVMAVALLVGVAQVGKAASAKAARPRVSRLSPKNGFQRLFSPRIGWELAKQVLKLSVLVAVGYFSLHALALEVAGTTPASITPLVDYAGSSLLGFVRTVAVLGLALGAADYGVQRHRMNQSLKMTKQEVRDERKQQEGDPTVRAQLRRRQFVIARSRMIAAVKTADVVVANPTHVAVALQYDPQRSGVPRVVAKGIDTLAQRIREEAARVGVPVVEDPPLARYLHATCPVGDDIPAEIYVAVAQLIAFVYSLKPAVRGAGVHRPPHSVVPEIEPDAPPAGLRALKDRRRLQIASRGSGGNAA